MDKKIRLIFYLLASAGVSLVCYIFFHELGHLIVMLSAGEIIDDFSIIGAHVSGHGGVYTNVSDLWLHANGAFFPCILAFLYLLFYQREWKKTFYRIVSFYIGLIPIASLLAWVLVPIAFMKGNAPLNDDVTKFLLNSSQTHSPLIVILVAALLIGIGLVLMIKKGVVKNYIFEIKVLRGDA